MKTKKAVKLMLMHFLASRSQEQPKSLMKTAGMTKRVEKAKEIMAYKLRIKKAGRRNRFWILL